MNEERTVVPKSKRSRVVFLKSPVQIWKSRDDGCRWPRGCQCVCRKKRVYPGFPTLFWGLSGFFVNDLMGKALWKPRGKRAAFSKVRWARSVRPRRRQLPQGPSVCDKIGASSDCSRPVNDYVHIEAADLRRPNARFTTERQGYQVLTPFGKLGYSRRRYRRTDVFEETYSH